jgi:cyclopropane fatty-acyl-phospholipid synthase-like methyltransferase
MIRFDGWREFNIWEHSRRVRDLYERRCRMEEAEMTCAAQAVELLLPHLDPGDAVLDAGCGSGYLFHSFRGRGLDVEYYGIDAAASLVEIGRAILPAYGLPAERLQVARIEDLAGSVDHVICMNVLSNIDNYHRPLERLLSMAGKTLILRESVGERAQYRYVRDEYLDPGVRLNVYVNTYSADELMELVRSCGFVVERVEDRRSGGRPEIVIGYPHDWTFFVARRTSPP